MNMVISLLWYFINLFWNNYNKYRIDVNYFFIFCLEYDSLGL